jgi:hypothetical protein
MTRKNKFAIYSALILFVNLGVHLTTFELITRYKVLIIMPFIIGISYLYFKEYSTYKWYKQKTAFVILFLISQSIFLNYFPLLGTFAVVIFTVGLGFWTYFLFLGLNIYYVSDKRAEAIPLIQPARTVVFVSNLVLIFLASVEIYKVNVLSGLSLLNTIVQILLFIIFIILMTWSMMWFIYSHRVGEVLNKTSFDKTIYFLIVVITSQIYLLTMLFPFEDLGRAIIVTSVVYVLMNFIINYISHKITYKYYLESVFIILFVYLIAYLI